jgi:hypothetical protein
LKTIHKYSRGKGFKVDGIESEGIIIERSPQRQYTEKKWWQGIIGAEILTAAQ